MSENEEVKQKLFNAHCAKIMGYYREEFSGGEFYFEKDSQMVCPVDMYNPYDDIQQILPIIDSLISAIGLSLKSGTIQRHGLQVACRELILGTILTDDDKEELGIVNKEVIKGTVGEERFWENEGRTERELTDLFDLTDAQLNSTYDPLLDVEEGWDKYDKMIEDEANAIFGNDLITFPNDKPMLYEIFNYTCAEFIQYETMRLNLGYGDVLAYAPTRDGWDSPEEYNPFEDMAQLAEVMEKVLAQGLLQEDDYDIVEDMHNDGFRNTWINIVSELLIKDEDRREMFIEKVTPNDGVDVSGEMDDGWRQCAERIVTSKTVPEAINKLADAIDALPTPSNDEEMEFVDCTAENCTNFGYAEHGADYPDIKAEQAEFNHICSEIMFTHARAQGGDLLLAQKYDPYYNANETINVFEIVLQYLPRSIDFTIVGRAEFDDPTDQNILKWIQDFICKYGTDEYMLPPAKAFNKMCATLVEGYNIYDCQPINCDFDPYNNMEDLAPILPVIIKHTPDHPFKIPGVLLDNAIPREERENMDLFSNMLFYVQCYGKDVVDILESSK